MTGESLSQTLNSALRTDVVAALPKFSYDFGMSLNEMLIAMGMPSAFDAWGANFRRLGNPPPGENLYISNVLHKTFIEVDERGTKAAAVTSVEVVRTVSVSAPPKMVVLDRPFVYVIIDNQSKLPIFIGALMEMP
jgi:serpin B